MAARYFSVDRWNRLKVKKAAQNFRKEQARYFADHKLSVSEMPYVKVEADGCKYYTEDCLGAE